MTRTAGPGRPLAPLQQNAPLYNILTEEEPIRNNFLLHCNAGSTVLSVCYSGGQVFKGGRWWTNALKAVYNTARPASKRDFHIHQHGWTGLASRSKT